MPTRRELLRAKREARRKALEAQKAAEQRQLAEFLLNRDEAIKAEKDRLAREMAAWQKRDEAI